MFKLVFRLLKYAVLTGAVVGGGRSLWQNRERLAQKWESLAGASGIKESAASLMESVGPMAQQVRRLIQLKK